MYKVSLSNKENVFLDKDGYQSLVQNMNNNFVILNGELINPSFIISITKVNLEEVPTKYLPQNEISGHIDEEKGVYVVDKIQQIKKISNDLTNKFKI